MAAPDYDTLAAIVIAAGATAPAVYEQIGNYVLTNNAPNGRKYISLLPTFDVAALGASLVAGGAVTPPDVEQVGNRVLIYPKTVPTY